MADDKQVSVTNPLLTSYQRQSILIDCNKTFQVDPSLNLKTTSNGWVNKPVRVHEKGRNLNNTQYKGKSLELLILVESADHVETNLKDVPRHRER
jgi:hypothetical protein